MEYKVGDKLIDKLALQDSQLYVIEVREVKSDRVKVGHGDLEGYYTKEELSQYFEPLTKTLELLYD